MFDVNIWRFLVDWKGEARLPYLGKHDSRDTAESVRSQWSSTLSLSEPNKKTPPHASILVKKP